MNESKFGNDPRDVFRRNDGAAAVLLVVSLLLLLGLVAAAVDAGRLFAVRAELQTAVDAGALAGAIELANGGGDGSRDVAIQYAALNEAENQPVVVAPDQVTFGTWDDDAGTFNPLPSSVGADAIEVIARRSVSHYFAWALNLLQTNAGAGAIAWSGAPVGATDCMKPWAIPFELLDGNRDGSIDDNEVDVALGQEFRLKTASPGGTGDSLDASGIPSFFYAVVLPPFFHDGVYQDVSGYTGGDEYRDNIAACSPHPISVGDSLLTEPGNMPGPTIQGAREVCGEIVAEICNPYGTYSPDGQPGIPVIAGLWKSTVDPIGRRAVEVAALASFRLTKVYNQSSHAVIVGVFEGMSTAGSVGEEKTTLSTIILVR